MRAVDIIRAKARRRSAVARGHRRLRRPGWRDGSWADYQASALLMAIVLRGMTAEETAWLTDAMVRSGDARRSVVDSRHQGRQAQHRRRRRQGVDRAGAAGRPRAASSCRRCRAAAWAIPAARSTSSKRFPAFASRCRSTSSAPALADVGCCLISQTKDIAPADKKLYALRDVTATIESIPLISASVMSKKIAEGSDALVLDVKCGSGAFMKTADDARALARSLVAIGTRQRRADRSVHHRDGRAARLRRGQRARDRRVHRDAAGQGAGGSRSGRRAARLADGAARRPRGETTQEAEARVREALASGAALAKFAAMIARQGGDARDRRRSSRLPRAANTRVVARRVPGYVAALDAELVGRASMLLGAGREKVERLDRSRRRHHDCRRSRATRSRGEPVLELHYNDGTPARGGRPAARESAMVD